MKYRPIGSYCLGLAPRKNRPGTMPRVGAIGGCTFPRFAASTSSPKFRKPQAPYQGTASTRSAARSTVGPKGSPRPPRVRATSTSMRHRSAGPSPAPCHRNRGRQTRPLRCQLPPPSPVPKACTTPTSRSRFESDVNSDNLGIGRAEP